ncbi:MAG: hypothetical protein ACQZ2J_01960 [Pseudomonas piscis]|uniref:hypothetical protein n=1 Tax=Pseudomonas piscis TaxID=2614538 RepID=UPI003D28E872
MTASATTTFAHRLGSALGTAARFCLHDRSPMVRWIKRAIVLVVLGAVLVNEFSWILSALLMMIPLGFGLFAFSKAGTNKVDLFVKDKGAPYGRDGVMGAPLNMWGERRDGFDRDQH